MWQLKTETESNGRILKFAINNAGGEQLRFADVFALWCDSVNFCRYFTEQLAATPYTAFRWETPPVTTASLQRPFECVVLNSPGLVRAPDVAAFSDYFQSQAVEDTAVFPNLGNDAILVVPYPIASHSAYGHLAAFLRKAPERQKHSLWRSVGRAMLERLSSQPIWLNTAGAGVSWLHVRLDSRPKYYCYSPYTRFT